MECVVKNNNLRKLGTENINASSDALNMCGVVEGSKVAKAFNAFDNIFRNKCAFLEESTALNNSVTDS